ncbi:hypothetical protein DFH06DRAFT_1150810 [Mycena polygramma]|nr:hypothetical protein DFH06DRAFT_1150810 [Mycena polygramma]
MARKRKKARVQELDAEKRREANRRYYQSYETMQYNSYSHFESRSLDTQVSRKKIERTWQKNAHIDTSQREAQKKYRRQWDPPKKLKVIKKRRPTVREDGSVAGSSQHSASSEDLTEDEAAAHAALSALYHRTR